jgi:hypothetical protein
MLCLRRVIRTSLGLTVALGFCEAIIGRSAAGGVGRLHYVNAVPVAVAMINGIAVSRQDSVISAGGAHIYEA